MVLDDKPLEVIVQERGSKEASWEGGSHSLGCADMAGCKAQGIGGSSEIVCLRSGDFGRKDVWEVVG
jgi:hypothetical protein